MKLRFILSEDVNIQKHQAQLDAVSKRTGIPQVDLIVNLNEMDPNGNYTRWILKQIKFQNILIPEDNLRVWEVLQHFDRNKQRLEVKDIMQYKRVSDLEDALELVINTGSKRSGALQYNPMSLPGVEKVAEDGPFVLYHVTDADSLAELGEGTKWCTRRSYPNCQAEMYTEQNSPMYVITKNNRAYIQISNDSDSWYGEIQDAKNNKADVTELSVEIVKHVPILACAYAKAKNVRVPEAEPYIMKNPRLAYIYARQTLKRRWPEAEPYIMQSPVWSYWYAGDVIKGRWPEAEPLILRNREHVSSYVAHAMNGERWPEAEPIMLQDPRLARQYAQIVLKRPWPEAEPIIMKDPMEAVHYAVDVLHRRWYEAESIIMSDAFAAHYYQDWIENILSKGEQ